MYTDNMDLNHMHKNKVYKDTNSYCYLVIQMTVFIFGITV